MSRFLGLVLVGVALAQSATRDAVAAGGQAGAGRLFLLLIDDLHIEFHATPRARDLIRQVTRQLVRPDDRVAIVTTGYSSVSERPTSDTGVVSSALRRVTGGGLRPVEAVNASAAGVTERRRRAEIALGTARSMIEGTAAASGPKVMLLVSGGYDGSPGDGSTTESVISALALDAARSGVIIFAFDARALVSFEDPQRADVAPDLWTAHRLRSADSLRRLAEPTGGTLVSAPGELDAALQTIAAIR